MEEVCTDYREPGERDDANDNGATRTRRPTSVINIRCLRLPFRLHLPPHTTAPLPHQTVSHHRRRNKTPSERASRQESKIHLLREQLTSRKREKQANGAVRGRQMEAEQEGEHQQHELEYQQQQEKGPSAHGPIHKVSYKQQQQQPCHLFHKEMCNTGQGAEGQVLYHEEVRHHAHLLEGLCLDGSDRSQT